MNTKLSHSQTAKYQQCPKSYQYHYIDKLRSNVTSAALLFGSALDSALNVVLLNDVDNQAEVDFEKAFTNGDINGVRVYIPTSTQVVYANNDFDADLLSQEDYSKASEILGGKYGTQASDILENYKTLKDKKSQKGLSGDDLIFHNYLNWLCARQKGLLMLAAYRKKVIPKITKVHEVQKYVSLTNESGDSIIGYVDLIADIKGHGTVILDNKTSAREYAEDSVLTSPQLALYMHALHEQYQTRKAGYIVLRKNIMKNRKKVCNTCGYDGSGARHKTCSNVVNGVRCVGEWVETFDFDIFIQFIIDEIPEQTESIVLENTDIINEAIKTGIFPRNLNTCNNYYGGKCAYFDLCYKNKPTGLIKKEDSNG